MRSVIPEEIVYIAATHQDPEKYKTHQTAHGSSLVLSSAGCFDPITHAANAGQ